MKQDYITRKMFKQACKYHKYASWEEWEKDYERRDKILSSSDISELSEEDQALLLEIETRITDYSRRKFDYATMGYIGSINWHGEYKVSPEAGDYSHVFWDYSDEDHWRILSIRKPHFNGKVIRKGSNGISKD